jgi:hypothetical protein
MKEKAVLRKKEKSTLTDKETPNAGFVFDKENYKLLLIGIGFLVVGFALMVGGRSDSPDFFNYEMFNFQRLTLSPILLMIGYVIGIFAIMKRPRKSSFTSEEKSSQ